MREVQLHGTVFYDPEMDRWQGSGSGWWIDKCVGNTAHIVFDEPIKFNQFDDIEKYGTCDQDRLMGHYTLTVSNINHNGEVETDRVNEHGFMLRWKDYSDARCIASFTVIGLRACFVPNDRALTNEDSVADIYAAGLLFDYEAKYGFVTLMGSASIISQETAERHLQSLEQELGEQQHQLAKTQEPFKREVLQSTIEKIQRKIDRIRIVYDKCTRYWDSAYQFGQMWGKYAAEEQEDALGGAYVPICTGGGPGIMQAAAEGARSQNAHVVGIDCQFGYDNFFDLSDSYAVHSNQRLRMNNFSIREGVLINYSHVILFWPGGYGTLWEVTEVLSKISTMHLRRHRTKAIFVHREFWEPFFKLVDHLREYGTINAFGDLIKISGQEEHLPDDAYIAEVVDTAEEAFEKTRAFVEELHRRNQLTLRSE